jgi:predicted N-acetyltransferase YhbS
MNDDLSAIGTGPRIEHATAADREELLAFLLEVFRRGNPNHAPFDVIYPDLFLPDDEVMGLHAVIRMDGRIVSCVGMYPMTVQVGKCRVKSAGVGQVATDKDFLGRGFMTALMRHQLERARREGAVVAWLGGRRDRYSHFGFDNAGLSFDHCIDAHSIGKPGGLHSVSHRPATDDGAVTEAMFALREGNGQTVLEPLGTYLIQLTRSGFRPEIWTSSRDDENLEAWALFDADHRRVIEWCGTFTGRVEILSTMCRDGTVHRIETSGDAEMLDFLREHCYWAGPNGATIAVLDAKGLMEALAPFVPDGFTPKADDGPALVRELFGPGLGTACLPFHVPPLYHV